MGFKGDDEQVPPSDDSGQSAFKQMCGDVWCWGAGQNPATFICPIKAGESPAERSVDIWDSPHINKFLAGLIYQGLRKTSKNSPLFLEGKLAAENSNLCFLDEGQMFCSDPSVVVKEKREHPRVCCDLHLGVPTVFLPESRPNNVAAGTFNLDCLQIPFSHSVPGILKSTQTTRRYQVLLAPGHHTLIE